jgi:hypothetical protein
MTQPTDDDILQEINRLADEEHELGRAGGEPSQTQSDRRREIEVALDQRWDLLRQRRARRSAGEDPADAAVRSAGVVERYQQ